MRWELEAEKRILDDYERSAWMKARKLWDRVKWDSKGDENSKFFHSFVKRRNNKNNIRGLTINGVWCEDPVVIKSAIVSHYIELFSKGSITRPIFCCERIDQISVEDATSLEKEFNEYEVWDTVRGCGSKKALEVSGLRFNYNKSKLYGVGFVDQEISEMARWMRCGVGEFPFTYLGLPIGENMRRVGEWNPMIEKFKKRLSEWKAISMSLEGCLTLVKSVLGSLPLYYFSMFHVPALLEKWWWRFKKEGEALWARVIKSIHGVSGGLGGVRGLGGREGWGTDERVAEKGKWVNRSGNGNGNGLETLEGGDCMMAVKEIVSRILEEVEKLEWWFELNIDEQEEDEEGEGGSEV
ncbi:hypothetical protein Tco_0722049 [Tanacetum coccineum]